jgi:hypothetical protein
MRDNKAKDMKIELNDLVTFYDSGQDNKLMAAKAL